MKTLTTTNIMPTGILLGAVTLSCIAFWRSDDSLVSLWCVVAAIGWAAWWHNGPASSATDQDSESSPDDKKPKATLAGGVAAPASPAGQVKVSASEGAPGKQGEQKQKEPGNSAPHPLSEQIHLALAESEQAVGTALKAFEAIAAEALQMRECAGEMMRWRTDTNPMLQGSLTHLLERSTAIGQNIDRVVVSFQFQDVLRQRLEHTARLLDGLSASSTEKGIDPTQFNFASEPDVPQTELF